MHTNLPLGESCTGSVVLCASLGQVIQSLCHSFSICACKGNNTLIHLDTRDDALLLHQVNKASAIIRSVVQGLLVADGAADICAQPRGAEQQLSVITAVFLSVLNTCIIYTINEEAWGRIGERSTWA
jgi:hypothetical protein